MNKDRRTAISTYGLCLNHKRLLLCASVKFQLISRHLGNVPKTHAQRIVLLTFVVYRDPGTVYIAAVTLHGGNALECMAR